MQKSAESRKTTVARRWPSSVTVIESVSSSIAHTHAAPSRWLGRVAVAILRLGFRVRVGAKVKVRARVRRRAAAPRSSTRLYRLSTYKVTYLPACLPAYLPTILLPRGVG